jgi:hypothetical protein
MGDGKFSDATARSGEDIVVFTAVVKLLRIPEMNPAHVRANTTSCQARLNSTNGTTNAFNHTLSQRPYPQPHASTL